MTDHEELLLTSQLSLHPCCLSYRLLPSRPRSRRTKPKDNILFHSTKTPCILVTEAELFWSAPRIAVTYDGTQFSDHVQNILFVFSANRSDFSDLMGDPWTQTSGVVAHAQKIGSGQRSRFFVLIKRSAPSGYENYRRASFGQQQESRPLTGYEFSEQAQSTHFIFSANHTFRFLPKSVNRCWPKGTLLKWQSEYFHRLLTKISLNLPVYLVT